MTLEFLLQDLPVFLLPIRPPVRRPLVPNGTFTTRRFAYRDEPGNRTGKYTIPRALSKRRRDEEATYLPRHGSRARASEYAGRKG